MENIFQLLFAERSWQKLILFCNLYEKPVELCRSKEYWQEPNYLQNNLQVDWTVANILFDAKHKSAKRILPLSLNKTRVVTSTIDLVCFYYFLCILSGPRGIGLQLNMIISKKRTFAPVDPATSNSLVLNSNGRQLHILCCTLKASRHRAAPSMASIWQRRSPVAAAEPIAVSYWRNAFCNKNRSMSNKYVTWLYFIYV